MRGRDFNGGQSLSCQPEIVCLATTHCEKDEITSRCTCEEREANCHGMTVCNEIIFCRADDPYRGISSCGEDELESLDPCLALEFSEKYRSVPICGETIACQ